MKEIIHNDRKVAFNQQGKGIPVVLVHGFCEDQKMWEDFQQDLLEENYRVVTIDLPGFGLSEPIPEPSIAAFAEAVMAVAHHLKLPPFVLIGHSMGGYTALAFAQQYAQHLLGLGLFHSHPFADPPEKKQDRYRQVTFLEKYGHALYVKQLFPKLFPAAFVQSRPFLVDKMIHRAARYTPEGIIGGLVAMAERPDYAALLKQLELPVLFIVGQLDEAVPAVYSQQQLALPKVASVHVLPGIGHMGFLEDTRTTQLIVRRFVVFCEEFRTMASSQ